MNKKLMISLGLVGAIAGAQAEIAITDNLSIEGFVDMSYTLAQYESGATEDSVTSFNVDQVEIDFLYDFGNVSAQVDIDTTPGLNQLGIEQAFATYHATDSLSFTSGLYAGTLGFEAFEPTGLYQYSLAYVTSGNSFDPIPGYNVGVKAVSEFDGGYVSVGLQDAVWNGDQRLGGSDADFDNGNANYGVELAGAFEMDALTVFAGGVYEDSEAGSAWLADLWVSYEVDALTLGAEFVYGEFDANTGPGLATLDSTEDQEGMWGLLMANYAVSDQMAITLRASYLSVEDDADTETSRYKLTFSPSYAWSDNLLTVVEVSYIDGETETPAGDSSYEEVFFAIEQIFSF